MSCGSAGNCSAGGFYTDNSGRRRAFVVSEANGAWGTAQKVPPRPSTRAGDAGINSVSCASVGSCSAGGSYTDPALAINGFWSSVRRAGTWGTAHQVAAALNAGGNAVINSVSCASAGNCTAGGFYAHASPVLQAFAVSETNGTWGTAHEARPRPSTPAGQP